MHKKLITSVVLTLTFILLTSMLTPAFADAATSVLTENQGETVAEAAKDLVGNRGTDNTGFVKHIFGKYGVDVSSNMDELKEEGEVVDRGAISYNSLQPGDVLYFGSSYRGIDAVAIYVGNDYFVGASSAFGGVVSKRLSDFRNRYYGARRMYQPTESAPITQPTEPIAPQQPDRNTSSYGDKILDEAMDYRGVPYVFGSSASTTTSFDCSSFVQRSVYDAGLGKLPRTARAQASYMRQYGQSVSRSQLQPGDLIFFVDMGTHVPSGTVSHVGFYAGNNKIIQAMPNRGVIISDFTSYYTTRVAGAYRMVTPVQ